VKPLASIVSATAGKWTEKNVSKLNVSITAEGFAFEDETENGFDELVALWHAAAPVTCKYCHRDSQSAGYWTGSFVVSNLAETAPAGDDATYSLTLENSGEVVYEE
jgi:predicted secreted protein